MKYNKTKIIIAILALSTLYMAATGITPALSEMAAAFPNVSSATIQMTLSLPALFVVPFALLSGWMVTVLPKKTLLLCGVILVGIGGLAPILISQFAWILVSRALLGIGVGFIMPIAPSVVTDYFEGYKCSSIMGIMGALTCGGGIFNSLIGGILADIGWRYNFLVYLTTIPIFFIVLAFLPKDEKIKAQKSEKVRIPSKVIYICLVCLLFTTAKFAFTLNISMFMSEEQLGDAAMTGIISSVYTAGGFVAGFIFGKMTKLFKNYVLATGMLFAAVGMLVVFISTNMFVLFIGAFLLGSALSIVNPRFNVLISQAASPKSLAMSLAICMAMMNLGQFAAPITFNTLAGIFGFTTIRYQFLLAAVALFAMGIASIISNFIKNRISTKLGAEPVQQVIDI